jgi:hypothetical protein
MADIPGFGTTGTVRVQRRSRADRADQLTIPDGFSKLRFVRSITKELVVADPLTLWDSYGIAGPDSPDNSLNRLLTRVTLTCEEQVASPAVRSVAEGDSPAEGAKLTYHEGVLFPQIVYTVVFDGRGDPPTGMTKAELGTLITGSFSVYPARAPDSPPAGLTVAVLNTITANSWQLINVADEELETDFEGFSVTLESYTENEAATAKVQQLQPVILSTDELNAISSLWAIRRTMTFNEESEVSVEENATIYDDGTVEA